MVFSPKDRITGMRVDVIGDSRGKRVKFKDC